MPFTNFSLPSSLKMTNVIPIYKKNDKTHRNNHKSMSLISNIDKIMEKLMFQRLYFFLEYRSIIYQNPSGFCNMYSTEHALIMLNTINPR